MNHNCLYTGRWEYCQRLDNRSRMSREVHVRFCEGLRVKFPRSTRRIIHCQSKQQAKLIQKYLQQRLQECFLELHPKKTRTVYCKDSNRKQKEENIQFTFLGYTFKPRKAKSKTGTVFTSFLPAISKDAKKSIYQEIRNWRLLWMTNQSISNLARKYNPIIRGWLNYYGKYGKKELARVLEHLNLHLIFWVRRKYRRYKWKPKEASRYLVRIANHSSHLFEHWKVGVMPTTG